MTLARVALGEGSDGAEWPWSHRQAFLERLRAQGYSRWSLRQYGLATESFCAAIEKRALGAGDLDGATVERLRRAVVKEVPEYVRTWGEFCVARFIEHLAESGVAAVSQPPAKRLTARECLREEYEAYLRRQRGLAEGTVRNSLYYGERFLSFRFGEKLGDLRAITPDDIVAFLRELSGRGSGRSGLRAASVARRDDAGGRGGLFRAPATRHAARLASSDRQFGAKAGAGERRQRAKRLAREALT